MDELQAAFRIVELTYLDERNSRRRAVAARYLSELSGTAALKLPFARMGGGAGLASFLPCAIAVVTRSRILWPRPESAHKFIIRFLPICPEPTHKQVGSQTIFLSPKKLPRRN
jgi:dTDP-4-amino-4,6-dideoxygalactose transaminase